MGESGNIKQESEDGRFPKFEEVGHIQKSMFCMFKHLEHVIYIREFLYPESMHSLDNIFYKIHRE